MTTDFIRLKEGGNALNAKDSLEKLLSTLRSRGSSIVESIAFVARLGNLSLAEAKRLVHCSDTWQNFRTGHEQFHEELEATLEVETDRTTS